jgi:hypothetical protein
MELFKAAGVDLPTSEGAKARRARALTRSLHVPLFNYRVIAEAKSRGIKLFSPTAAQLAAAAEYARKIQDPKFLKGKEMAVREMLVQEVIQAVLGYKPYDPSMPYNLAREWSTRGGPVDVALGSFNEPNRQDEVIAPFELKGPDTADLDRVMPGRGRSPVQQAWDYAIDIPGSRWVLVSNCLEIRLYGFGRGRNAYEQFDLRKLDEIEEHHRLWLIVGAANMFAGVTDKLLSDTDSAYDDITNDLYGEYKGLRESLIRFLVGEDGPQLATVRAIEIAQKLLDRVIFIAFAQRTDLMADRLLEKASKERNTFAPQPLWRNFLGLFKAVDKGDAKLGIPSYNGGLFAEDPIADQIMLPDGLAEEVARLGQWDYRRQVPVTVLGHLFEQSITDIEAMKAGGAPPAVSKKKREGVVYTPDMVTRFLVERTVGRSLEERRAALWREHAMGDEPTHERQIAFWSAYLNVLRDFTIVDPACGSGAFLVAAFDEMARRYSDAISALEELEVEGDFDAFDQMVSHNLHGVDLNAEAVEITRLSLWLKTARRDHKLQSLEATVKEGNSLVDDAGFTPHPFDWRARFPDVFARGGFDVVIGNPPYVRMEHLKEIKPYFSEHYVVADERTDLYAYFFEKGVHLLKPGGRLGYISSSTFFRTGSGENLRNFLSDGVALEAVVDFGDVQVFAGVTTYPAILTLRKGVAEDGGELSFLRVRDKVPEDLERAFIRDGQAMPRARLGKGSWQLEGDALAALRAKITAGRKSLGEVYGPPLYGIKTGLNKAFVIDRKTRDDLVKDSHNSAELLLPFLRGGNIKRWRVESGDLFLINTPRGKVDIDAYPAVRNWLAPFRAELEGRATKQEWWELQQAQLAYQPAFATPKLVWPDISPEARIAWDEDGYFLDCTSFFVTTPDRWLVSYLNSRVAWFFWKTLTPEIRGGFARLKAQFVGQTPVPLVSLQSDQDLSRLGEAASDAATKRHTIEMAVRHRILDLAHPHRRKLNARLEAWHQLDFAAFRGEVKKALAAEIPLRERGEWEAYLAESGAEVGALTARIVTAERDIDTMVYGLFDLTPDEVGLLEASLVP